MAPKASGLRHASGSLIADLEVSARSIGGVDGDVQKHSEGETRPVSERQTEPASFGDQSAGQLGLTHGEGASFMDRAKRSLPRIGSIDPVVDQLALHFRKIDRTTDRIAESFRGKPRFLIEDGEQGRSVKD